MSLRVADRLGLADVMTLANAAVGMVAMAAAALGEVRLVAQLILLAAVADGLDGIIARTRGGTAVGPYLDSMADIVSFGTAPGLFVFVAANDVWGPLGSEPPLFAAAAGVAALFVVFSLVRTALYTVYVGEDENRPGIQNTLASSILAAAYLAGLTLVPGLLAATVVLSVLMVAPVPYPKLAARDALAMGVVQMGAIVAPTALRRVFPRVLLIAALAYLTLAPRFYWEE
ncbi:phosphatidylcholine/phosphatidylserine synthase [Halovenus sp. WSH3]|uniref:Phosphatidylcholine/phosphatidylserine synthase n=1 Tax=Halovenus carboxidivorans TaxID=2692199 RepID=A0A6B0T6A8_9EURY|nr:protein sorting system archaetidylserine synthase [Halovenus carboxidivorans]MXR50751.1 phosphatidylcholine/phosphatidylserine synthase [Halovenus carboxidivorans]